MGQSSSSSAARRQQQQQQQQQQQYYPPPPPPPPPPQASYAFAPPPYSPYNQETSNRYSVSGGYLRLLDQFVGRNQFTPYHVAPSGRLTPSSVHPSPHAGPPVPPGFWAPVIPPSSQPPPPFVEHQEARTIKNDVNLHKDTIKLERDELFPDQYLVSFTFDSLVDGSITIFYFAKEGEDCSFSAVYPEFTPRTVPFNKGIAQTFRQPSGTGTDLGFFEIDDLSKPLNEDIFPLVIYIEANPSTSINSEQVSQSVPGVRAQITQTTIEKKSDGSFSVKVMKQILWIDGERYELQEIFGLERSEEPVIGAVNDDNGTECVICLSERRDTAVFPCRHLCMCGECAKALRVRSNKCPICRQPIEKLMEIKVESSDN